MMEDLNESDHASHFSWGSFRAERKWQELEPRWLNLLDDPSKGRICSWPEGGSYLDLVPVTVHENVSANISHRHHSPNNAPCGEKDLQLALVCHHSPCSVCSCDTMTSLLEHSNNLTHPLEGDYSSGELVAPQSTPCAGSRDRNVLSPVSVANSLVFVSDRKSGNRTSTPYSSNRSPANLSQGGGNGNRVCRSLLSGFSEASSILCRICHDTEKNEDLISPCRCSGTMGLMHRTCIEKWLSSSNTDRCEICHYVYKVKREPLPVAEWFRNPSRPTDKRNLIGDIVCFFLLTPLATVSIWLCLSGAMQYTSWETQWEASGLVALSMFLLVIYLVWCLVAIRYHCRLYMEWKEHNQKVQVLDYNVTTDELFGKTESPTCSPMLLQMTQINCDNLTNPASSDFTLSAFDHNSSNKELIKLPSSQPRAGLLNYGRQTSRENCSFTPCGVQTMQSSGCHCGILPETSNAMYMAIPQNHVSHSAILVDLSGRGNVTSAGHHTSPMSCNSHNVLIHTQSPTTRNTDIASVHIFPQQRKPQRHGNIPASISDTAVCVTHSPLVATSANPNVTHIRWCDPQSLRWTKKMRETFV